MFNETESDHKKNKRNLYDKEGSPLICMGDGGEMACNFLATSADFFVFQI